MRLVYLTANAAWCYVMGDALIRISHEPMLYQSYTDAVRAALRCGLAVDSRGNVSAID